MKNFDFVILGWGAGAFSAAIKASELSNGEMSIAMIGKPPIGGTCVNVGCVPSKYLLEASHLIYYPNHSEIDGISIAKTSFNFKNLMEGLKKFVEKSRDEKYSKVIKNYKNVTLYEGVARFRDEHKIEILDNMENLKETITGEYILIAVGSSPSVPNIKGLDKIDFITSDTLWNLKKLPESLTIIGGGSIGLEIGQAFLHLGSKVTIIEALANLLPQTEPEISQALQKRLEKEGMIFHLRARVSSISKNSEKKVIEVVTHKGTEVITTDEILVATGRGPNTHSLLLDNAEVKTDKRGFIKTDDHMRTSNFHIFAAGDCVSKKLYLETLAGREGVVAASNIFGEDSAIDYKSVVWAVFTYPQIAAVGETEKEYTARTKACSCRTFSLQNLTKASMLHETDGLIKITVDPANNKVVGMHIFSPNAIEMIVEGAYAVKHGFTIEDIISTSHIFPSWSEAVKIAAQSFIRDVSKMSCCVE